MTIERILKKLGVKGKVYVLAFLLVLGLSGCSCANRNGQEVNQNSIIEEETKLNDAEEIEVSDEEQDQIEKDEVQKAIEDLDL